MNKTKAPPQNADTRSDVSEDIDYKKAVLDIVPSANICTVHRGGGSYMMFFKDNSTSIWMMKEADCWREMYYRLFPERKK